MEGKPRRAGEVTLSRNKNATQRTRDTTVGYTAGSDWGGPDLWLCSDNTTPFLRASQGRLQAEDTHHLSLVAVTQSLSMLDIISVL